MSANAAGAVLMWMAGVMVGIAANGDPMPIGMMGAGAALTILGMLYIRRFGEK